MSDTTLSVGYLNVNGLSAANNPVQKWPIILSMLNDYDLLFVAETWYVNQARVLQHPSTVCSTSNPNGNQVQGRQHGGMVLLASTQCQQRISSVVSNEYMIDVTVDQLHIVGVYAPPSLSDRAFCSLLHVPAHVDVLLGDFNVRFGSEVGDTRNFRLQRKASVRQMQTRHSLRHVRGSVGQSLVRLDHAFVRYDMPATLSLFVAPFYTPHPVMHLCLPRRSAPISLPPSDSCTQDPSTVSVRRFHTSSLECDVVQSILRAEVDEAAKCLRDVFAYSQASVASLNTSDRQELIDWLDGLMLDCLNECCESVLGSYTVQTVRAQPDQLLSQLSRVPSSAKAIQLFHRAQRLHKSEHRLQSRSPDLSANEDAVVYFTEVFAQPDVTLHASVVPECMRGVGDAQLGVIFVVPTVRDVIMKYAVTKSAGMDGIHTLILRAVVDSQYTHLLSQLYQLCVACGLTPRRWNRSLIYPLPKTNTAEHISDMRPIALTVMFRRVFEACLMRYIDFASATSGVRAFHASQAGFRRGYSTLTHAIASHEHCIRSSSCVSVFLDIRAAYDSVPVPLLMHKLHRRGLSPCLLSVVCSLFLECSSQCVVNGQVTKPFDRQRGVFQGSLLSPFLFNVYIDDLAKELERVSGDTDPYAGALLCADDILLQHDDVPVVQRMLNTCSRWASTNGMTFNIKKCASLVKCRPPLQLDGVRLPVVDEYKYLGFPHKRYGIDWLARMFSGTDKARRFLGYLRSQTQSDLWPEWVRGCLFKCFIRPCYEYGAPIIYHVSRLRGYRDALVDLEAFHDEATAWITGVRNATRISKSSSAKP